MQKKLKEEARLKREERNALFRAYGYHWKKTEQLTSEQRSSVPHPEGTEIPKWALLSPLDIPVSEYAVSQWLGTRGYSPDDIIAFLADHGFTPEGKDAHGAWRILSPSGNETLNLKQALQELERMRLDYVQAKNEARRKEMQEEFDRSVKTLQETLERHGRAVNDYPAWGYSPQPMARLLPDGEILVRTYHFEGDWQEDTFESAEDVVGELYCDGDGQWDIGEWYWS